MSDRKEYIERGALLRDIEGSVVISRGEVSPSGVLRGAVKVLERIRVAPTADVVEVVRCRDCKERHSSEYCECRPDDFFCADGERKDGAENGECKTD